MHIDVMLDVALQIFFLIDPLTAAPILFLGYKKKYNIKKIAIEATFLAFGVAIAFILIGPLLFRVFGTNITSVKAAGGILIILLGLSMARGFGSDEKTTVTTADALTSLLSTPMLTGPATLTYLAVKTTEIGTVALIGNTAIAFVMVGLVFFGLARMMPNMNMKYIDITSRIFGMFLLALGIEMLAASVKTMML